MPAFSETINASTVTTTTFQLRNAGNNLIPASVSTSAGQITLDPTSALANSTVYTATITGGASGVKDLAGNALASNYSWSFTTVAGGGATYSVFPTTALPAEPLNNDGQGIVLGMKLRSTQNGNITGVRYYKGPGTTGTHTGHLWTSTGTLLGSATFTGETASGWQQTLFATPIAITANITYVVSLFSPSGHYAATAPYFTSAVVNGPLRALANGEDGPNGLFRYSSTSVFPNSSFSSSNYWVDVVFTTGGGAVNITVTTQPASQTRCAGTTASFTSAASGTPTPTVQWQVSTNGTTWTNITGATSSPLTFATTTADNNKQYRAVWTNSGGTVNSNPAILTVNPIPVLSSNLSATATSGSAFSYTATSTTTGTVFAWSRAAVTGISNPATSGTGNINETLVNTTTSPVNVTYVYTLTANGCSNTQNLVVTVNTGGAIVSPTVTTQPASQTRCAGIAASFTSAASGTPTPTVQWQVSTNGTTWSNITGATSSPLTFAATTADNNKQYRAVWTNSGGAVNSNAAVLTVNPIPVLSSNLSATATSGSAFSYTATSTTTGTVFAWSRAAVTGISNPATSGTGNISETLVNTTTSPVNVTYVYTLTAAGCINTQNLVVTVNPASTINCVINGNIASNFTSTSIPAGRYIWFSSVIDRGSFIGVSGTVTFTVTNARITFTANSQTYTLNVPNSRIRFDAAVTSASTQFLNGMWETAVPRSYTSYVFMGGLAYQVPSSLPGNISNVRWTATISIDKAGVRPTWKWAAAVYTSFAAHAGLNIKPKNGSTQNPYPNNNNAGTPENFKSFVVSGAKGSGGTNYTGSYSSTSTATCVVGPGQRSAAEPLITRQIFPKQIPALPIDRLANETLEVSAVPNPSSSIFNLIIKGSNTNSVQVRVTDVFGRIVEHYEKISANTILQIGQRLRGGSYFVEVIQADQRKFVKIIKVN